MPSSIDLAISRLTRSLNLTNDLLVGDDGPDRLLRTLGWRLPTGVSDIGLRKLNLTDVLARYGTLQAALDSGVSGLTLDADYAALLVSVSTFLQGLDAVVSGFAATPDFLTKTQIQSVFATRFLDFLVVEAMAEQRLFLLGLAIFAGIVEITPMPADDSIYQVAHLRRTVHWDRIPRLFSDINGLMTEVYGWNTPGHDGRPETVALGNMLAGFGLPNQIRPLPRAAEANLVGHDVPEAETDPATQLLLSLYRTLGPASVDAGVSFISLRPSSSQGTDGGVAITPYAIGTTLLTFPITQALSFDIDSTLDTSTGVAATIRPTGIGLTSNLAVSAPSPIAVTSGHVLFLLDLKRQTPVTLLSIADGVDVIAGEVLFGGGIDISGGKLSPLVKARVSGGHVRLDTSRTDSFLSSLIPINVDLGFDLGVGWSASYGFFIEGNASAQIDFGIHQSIGPFQLDTLHVGLTLGHSNSGTPDLPLEVSFTGKGTLGPLTIAVQRLGMTADVTFKRGNLGPAQLDLGIKPPTGLGIKLDAGLISGGGFLSIDPVKQRYFGTLDCELADIVQVKIIAVIDLQNPDGSKGFSFLLVITGQFPPIQLGFGFALTGVGGVGGINRSMSIPALQAGLKAHTLNDLLFPQDPVGNAPQILSDMESFFPIAPSRYVFGPMLEITWGTPPLIFFHVGVILEVPDPIRIAILGQVEAELPSQDTAVVEMHLDVLGTIDFGTRQLAILGSLYNSRITVFALSGDMAMLLSWGDNPNFAFSVGGLNPHFQPPPNLPGLKRMTVSLGDGDNPRLSCTSYFAVTSNSLQFGAQAELWASAAGFSVHGYVGFDALFIFSPFSFEIDLAAGVDVNFQGTSLCSIHLDGLVGGPHPWHVRGSASFHILFFDVGAGFDFTWGDPTPVTLPPKSVLDDLIPALQDPHSWSVQLPDRSAQFVSLTPLPAGGNALVVHPMGQLQVKEKVVPLNQKITKYGNFTPQKGDEFSISGLTVGGQSESTALVSDYFAIGQFNDLSDSDKLAAPSFQSFPCGVSVGSTDIQSGTEQAINVTYEEDYVYADDLSAVFSRFYNPPLATHLAWARKGAGFVNALAGNGVTRYQVAGTRSPVSVQDMGYVIASTVDLSLRGDLTATPITQYEAQNILAAHLAANPGDTGALQVVPMHLVAA